MDGKGDDDQVEAERKNDQSTRTTKATKATTRGLP
jgi:hypothetical protein